MTLSPFIFYNNIFFIIKKMLKEFNPFYSPMPTKKDCGSLDAWHFPWNNSKYKNRCQARGCIHDQSFFGSYCEDPVTVSNRRLERAVINDIKLALMTPDELFTVMNNNIVGDEEFITKKRKEYTKKRYDAIVNTVVNPAPNLLVRANDEQLLKIALNAKNENIDGVRELTDLKYTREGMRLEKFNELLGDKEEVYKKLTIKKLNQMFQDLGIEEKNPITNWMYRKALDNYNKFSDEKKAFDTDRVSQVVSEQNMKFYLARYKDLRDKFGTDISKAKDHYMNNGRRENRDIGPPTDMEMKQYLENYEDLRRIFGQDISKARDHFMTNGLQENRNLFKM